MNISLNSDVTYSNFKKGDLLFKEGRKIEQCFIVTKGSVALVKQVDKRETVFYVAKEKDIIGEDCVVSTNPLYFYSAVALEDIEVIPMNASEMNAIVDSHSDWIGNILDNISGKITKSIEMISEHRITDNSLYQGVEISDDDQVLIKSSLQKA